MNKDVEKVIDLYYLGETTSQKVVSKIQSFKLITEDVYCEYFKMTNVCKECNSKMNYTGFKNGFVCSTECRKNQREKNKNYGRIFDDLTLDEQKSLILKNVTKQNFISRKFLKDNNLTEKYCYDLINGTMNCSYCNEESKFINWCNGYSNKCNSNKCSKYQRKIRTEYTNLLRYNVKNVSESKVIIEKKLETFKKNYNVDNISQLKSTKEKIRATNEKIGKWKSRDQISDISIYYKYSLFKHGFKFNVLTTEQEKSLLNTKSVYNNRTNKQGCVRDHLLSRRYGFENNIPSWIISHPANCEIVQHSENLSRASRKEGDNLITLEQLLIRISFYEKYK